MLPWSRIPVIEGGQNRGHIMPREGDTIKSWERRAVQRLGQAGQTKGRVPPTALHMVLLAGGGYGLGKEVPAKSICHDIQLARDILDLKGVRGELRDPALLTGI